MAKIKLLLRADDAGLLRSKNEAAAELIDFGLVKNVSLMAPAPRIEEAYALFGKTGKVLFGLHGTINSEWDGLKFGPVSALETPSGLVDESGHFFGAVEKFKETKPTVESVIAEFDAQLAKLKKIGFKISYVDTHMFPEFAIPGLYSAVSDWARQNGLIDHIYYYRFIRPLSEPFVTKKDYEDTFRSLTAGEYFHVIHPSKESSENDVMYNDAYDPKKGGKSAVPGAVSELEYFSSEETRSLFGELGVETVTYGEAEPTEISFFDMLKRKYAGQGL